MKTTKTLWVILFTLSVCFFGCSTTPVPYSFAENESNIATVTFVSGNPGVRLVDYAQIELPKPENKTHWEPISFPAGRPLRFTVFAYYEQSNTSNQGLLVALVTGAITASRSTRGNVIFECPALEPGGNYSMAFRKGAGMPGKNSLVLTDMNTRKVVYEQEF